MNSIETRKIIGLPTLNNHLTDIQPSADDLHVFNVSLYANLFNQVIASGYTPQEARRMVVFAATNDGVGVITENISGSKNREGKYNFDIKDRIRMQLTPPRHFYLQEEDAESGQPLMVAPEHKWKDFRKDIIETISDWRRGTDKAGMIGVRTIFLDQLKNSLKEGEILFWCSPKAEEWEGEMVMKYNGQYGFLYKAEVVNINGQKALEVHDFKIDLNTSAYEMFLNNLDGEVYTNALYSKRPLLDRIKSTVIRTQGDWSDEVVWRRLVEVQKEVIGKAEIFGLPVEAILALQDPRLHQRIESEVAAPIAEWIGEQIYQGVDPVFIQRIIRQKFIDATFNIVKNSNKEERVNTKLAGTPDNISYIHQSQDNLLLSYKDIDPAILARYTGSNGDGCGDWGEVTPLGVKAPIRGETSVQVLSQVSAMSGNPFLEKDHMGPLEFDCPKCGGKNKRPKGGYVYNCQHCNTNEVSCHRPSSATSNQQIGFAKAA